MKVTIIGGGIIGLCSAYYLQQKGCTVTVVDKGDLTDNCSFGNLGYISPSHFVPLATPGIVRQGIQWMFDSSSPFYFKPRLDWDLIRWAWHFNLSANRRLMEQNMPHMNNLLQLSRRLATEMNQALGDQIQFSEKGCWMLYKKQATGDHEKHLADVANAYGLKTKICSLQEVQAQETQTEVNALGGVLYYDDAYVEPTRFMNVLIAFLKEKGVRFQLGTTIQKIEGAGTKASQLITDQGTITFDALVVANGSHIPEITAMMGKKILMQPGKGYSFVYDNLAQNLQYPSILADHRVATSPYGTKLRIGGTMEISGHSDQKLPKRIEAIYRAFRLYYPAMDIHAPDTDRAWYGYRPLTPDGVPYIGQWGKYGNVFIAGGHAMLGVSAAPGTGLLISEMVTKAPVSIGIAAFDAGRFG
jgi:D-amino-acid dehydrogenase